MLVDVEAEVIMLIMIVFVIVRITVIAKIIPTSAIIFFL
jgi:hypothetical protein